MTATLESELEVGIRLPNGATVVACSKMGDRVPGETYAWWVAICVREPENFHRYVVWNVVARSEGFMAEQGDYLHSLVEAIGVFQNRGGSL